LTNYLWSSICGEAQRSADPPEENKAGEAQRSADPSVKKDIDPSEGG